MPLETATYIADLVETNPPSNDLKAQGDDHIRLIKAVLKNTFPGANAAFNLAGVFAAKNADFTILKADQNTTYLVSTNVGAVVATLPTLLVGDAGWEVRFVKVTFADVNPLFIVPAAGTVISGEIAAVTKARRCIPGFPVRAIWTGSSWIITRIPSVPVGTVLDFHGAALPKGYEWPNGQTLVNAVTDYQEFYGVNGNSGVTLDARGRVVAGKDDMGGVSANRLTNQTGGLDGDVLGATGGAETHVLLTAQMPSHNHNATSVVTDPGHIHTYNEPTSPQQKPASAGTSPFTGTQVSNTSNTVTGITVATTNTPAGGDAAHNNVQPTIVLNKIICVE